MKVLIVDNYDSFTYNLVHYFESLDAQVTVVLNDQIDLDVISKFDKIVLSPGPGLPADAGQMNAVIDKYHQSKSILGVCLGFQAIYEFLGGSLYNQPEVKHGVSMKCTLDNSTVLFSSLPKTIEVGLYHSWAANIEELPDALQITAKSAENVLMAFEHVSLPIFGLQFHPESILTEYGKDMIKNFLAD